MHKIHVVLSVKLALIIFNHQKSKRVPEKHLLYWLCQSLWLCKLSHFSRVWLTLCNPIDGSPPGSPVPGILQARTLEWVAISFSSAWKWKVKGKVAQSCPTLSDPMDCSLQGSSVHGIFQVRALEWVAISFSTMMKRTSFLDISLWTSRCSSWI